MDLTGAVGTRFKSAAAKAGRRLVRGPRSKSLVTRGEKQDPAERLMDKILTASRQDHLPKKKADTAKKPVDKPAPETVIKPVPKDSSDA